MRLLAATLLASALSACSNHQPVTNAVVGGLIIYMAIDYSKEPRPMPDVSDIYDWRGERVAPPLAPGRRVVEQDCSKPLEDPTANLKCR